MKIDEIPERKTATEAFRLREWIVPPIVLPVLMIVGIVIAALVNR